MSPIDIKEIREELDNMPGYSDVSYFLAAKLLDELEERVNSELAARAEIKKLQITISAYQTNEAAHIGYTKKLKAFVLAFDEWMLLCPIQQNTLLGFRPIKESRAALEISE